MNNKRFIDLGIRQRQRQNKIEHHEFMISFHSKTLNNVVTLPDEEISSPNTSKRKFFSTNDFLHDKKKTKIDFSQNRVDDGTSKQEPYDLTAILQKNNFASVIEEIDTASEQLDIEEKNRNQSTFIQSDIKGWAVKYEIHHNAITPLMAILNKHYPECNFPKCAKTFLETPRSCKITKIDLGEYIHFGLKDGLIDFLTSEADTEEMCLSITCT